MLGSAPNESVPQASQAPSVSQSIYRFWSNKRVSPQEVLASHRPSVLERVNDKTVVLAIQDTTDLNFSTLEQTTGLGFTGSGKQQGFKVHSCFAVSGQGEPLGLLHQYTWSRPHQRGKRGVRRQKQTREKESQRWLDTLSAAEEGVNESVCLIHVGDREADIYDLFIQPRHTNSELLIRAEHNRKLADELGYLIPTIEQGPILGECTLDIHRNPQREARRAKLTLRAMEVTIEVPKHHLKRSQYQPVCLNVILVEEENPSDGGKPIRWLLLTTLAIETFEQVWQCVYWYSLRWLIERFHYTLKSGCRIEDLQLDSVDKLLKALSTYSIIAWRIMALTYGARLRPEDSCEVILEPMEWKLLRRKFQPKNRSKKPPTLSQAIRWIAQLGGFLARKDDGEPGLKTLWRGLGVLRHLMEGAQLSPKS